MTRRRHTPEQIVRKLREADRMLNEGADLASVGRRREAPEGARTREPAPEADRRRQGARDRRVAGDRGGKLLSPSQRRQAVHMLCDRKGFSQRRACQIVGQHRSTQRHQSQDPDPDKDLRTELRAFARRHPRWGYRRAHAVLRREGHHQLNRKKVQRLWREEGLRVPPRRHNSYRPHSALGMRTPHEYAGRWRTNQLQLT